MAPVTFRVINLPAGRLLRIEPEFGVGLATLNIAARKHRQNEIAPARTAQRSPENAASRYANILWV